MTEGQIRISDSRLLADLRELSRIGGRADGGVDRTAGSPADLAARDWLQRRILDAGLMPWTDEINNVFGRERSSEGPWLLVGSHTDTVPAGGWLDGAYGVMAALEVLRTLVEANHPAGARIEVVSFHDEEGTGPNGGLAGSRFLAAGPHVQDLSGYLELHIEQGPRLEAEKQDLGVVVGIVGVTQLAVEIHGEANHAGTTPIHLRRDSGLVLARIWVELNALVQSIDASMVATIGAVALEPGATNVVPGVARFTVDFRGQSENSLQLLQDRLSELVELQSTAAGCTATVSIRHKVPPTRMDPRLVEIFTQACRRSGRPWIAMWSGAGHDAGALATRVPAGMLFVPSRSGISHSPLEDTPESSLVLGAQLLLEAAVGACSS
jgi:N-carbamoyl-L-amino-acid hydrolase